MLPLKWCFRNLVCVYCDEPITKAGYISNTHNEYDYKCFKIAKKFFDDNDEIVLKFLGEKKYFCPGCDVRLDCFQTESYMFINKSDLKWDAMD